ncbi:MAG: ATP-binding cassette domain-containing protein, partial [Pyramidobacter sp.]|nr:ATP-binding cassette domain-containing protein [Pyramidobacter sp.]
MNDSKRILEVKDLTIHYFVDKSVVKAVNGISYELDQGESLGLVGETGAGKTTTALGIMRLVPNPPGRIVSGSILYKGEDLTKKSEED